MGFMAVTPILSPPPPSTVAGLPAASAAMGSIYQVTDALTPTIGAAVVGGGAVNLYVKSNGTLWLVQYLAT